MYYIPAHAPRRDVGLRDTAHRAQNMRKEDPRDIRWEGSLHMHSPTSHLEQDHHQHQNHPLPGTLNWIIPVLLYTAVNSLLSAGECLRGRQPVRRTKPVISRPCLLTWTREQAKVNCPITLRRKPVPPPSS